MDIEPTRRSQWTPEKIENTGKTVLLILGIAIVLGIFATVANLYYIAVLIGIAILIVLVSWQYEIALLIYVLVAFIPWGRTPDLATGGSGYGKGVYVSEIMLGFLLFIWACKYIISPAKGRIKSGFHNPLIVYLAYSVINVVHSYIFWDYAVSREWQKWEVNVIELGLRFLSAGAFFMMATSVSSSKWLKWTTILIMVPGVYNCINHAVGMPIPIEAPWWSLLSILPACYFQVCALDSEKKILHRILFAVMVFIIIFIIAVLNVSWISGWFGLLVGLTSVLFVKNKKIFAAAFTVFIVLFALNWPYISSNIIKTSQEEGDYDRFALMAGSIKYATNFPLGVGLGNYRTYNSYHYGDLWGTTSYTSAHGTYSQHLSEMGFPGFLILIVFLFSVGAWILKNYKKMPSGYSKNFMLAAFGQLVAISFASMIGDYIIPTFHNGGLTTFSATIYSWLIWGLAVAHVRVCKIEGQI